MEEEIRKNQNLESLGLLAGGIAHDFNNVLTGIVGGLTVLERKLDKDCFEYRMTKTAMRATERAEELSHQLLTFAKGGVPVKELASIEELVRDTAELSLRGSNTKPAYRFAQDLHAVDIDKAQIGQVIQDLVLNADQAMPAGGTLTLAAENVEVADLDPLPMEQGSYVKISVADQGIGMPANVVARIFDPYYTTKSSGHGLGLSITYSIMQKHNGHIAVRSQQDAGTTFDLYLPAVRQQVPASSKAEPELAVGTGRILLMDDEELVHNSVGMMLEMMGYEVESVFDGEAMLQTYRTTVDKGVPYDVVIMDLTIPGAMGGKEAMSKLREFDPQACALVFSGYTNDPILADYRKFGFAGAVTKPVHMQQMAKTLKEALRKKVGAEPGE